MLLLVTILLVVVGTISLVIGFVQSSLLPIYISIACSVLAAVVLLIFSRMTAKSQQVVTSGDGPTPLDPGRDRARSDQAEPAPAFAGTGLLAGSSSSAETFAPENRYGSGSGTDDDTDGDADLVAGAAPAAELDDDFPIERYDSRRVGEILPLLAELDVDELDIVREHEEQGKSRATVLARIDQLIDQLEAEDRHEAAHRLDTDTSPAVAAGLGGADDDGEHDDVSAPFAGPATLPPPPPTQPVTVAALPDDDGYFPIEDYDDLRASEILPLLPELDDDELVMVQERERSGAARSSVLSRIASLLPESTETAAVPPMPPEPIPVEPEPEPLPVLAEVVPPAKRAGAKRAPAAKKSVPQALPAKKAAPAKRTAAVAPPLPVKKAPAVRKMAPVKASKKAVPAPVELPAKVAAKKAPAGKVAAARAAAAGKGGGTASAAAAAKATKATRKTTKG